MSSLNRVNAMEAKVGRMDKLLILREQLYESGYGCRAGFVVLYNFTEHRTNGNYINAFVDDKCFSKGRNYSFHKELIEKWRLENGKV